LVSLLGAEREKLRWFLLLLFSQSGAALRAGTGPLEVGNEGHRHHRGRSEGGGFIPQTELDVDRAHSLQIEPETLGIAGFRLRCLYDCVLQGLPMTDFNAVPRKTIGIDEKAFYEVIQLIEASRERAIQAVNTTLIELYWQVGETISRKIEAAVWAMA
jgi:hypothetical protein